MADEHLHPTLDGLPTEVHRNIFGHLFNPADLEHNDGYIFPVHALAISKQLGAEASAALAHETNMIHVHLDLRNIAQWLRKFRVRFAATNSHGPHAINAFLGSGRSRVSIFMSSRIPTVPNGSPFRALLLARDLSQFCYAMQWWLYRESDIHTQWIFGQQANGEMRIFPPTGLPPQTLLGIQWTGAALDQLSASSEEALLNPLERMIQPNMRIVMAGSTITYNTRLIGVMGPTNCSLTATAWYFYEEAKTAYDKMKTLYQSRDLSALFDMHEAIWNALGYGFLPHLPSRGPAFSLPVTTQHFATPLALMEAILLDCGAMAFNGYLIQGRSGEAHALSTHMRGREAVLLASLGDQELQELGILEDVGMDRPRHLEALRCEVLSRMATQPHEDNADPGDCVDIMDIAINILENILILKPGRVDIVKELASIRRIYDDDDHDSPTAGLHKWCTAGMSVGEVIAGYEVGSTQDVAFTARAYGVAPPASYTGWT